MEGRSEQRTQEHIFSREESLIGKEALSRLASAHVAVFGLGGVGSYVTEALCRAGIGALSLIDNDRVALSNRNRQLYALSSTAGQKKTEAAKSRCLDINPDVALRLYDTFVLPENLPDLLDEIAGDVPLDYVVDAVDTVAAKLALAELCEARGIPLISCCGTGNKLDPSLFEISDIYNKLRGVKKLTVCYSRELPIKTGGRTPASISYVPGSAGLMIAGYVIRQIAGI